MNKLVIHGTAASAAAAVAAAAAAVQPARAAPQRDCVGRQLANRNQLRVSRSDRNALLFVLVPFCLSLLCKVKLRSVNFKWTNVQ